MSPTATTLRPGILPAVLLAGWIGLACAGAPAETRPEPGGETSVAAVGDVLTREQT